MSCYLTIKKMALKSVHGQGLLKYSAYSMAPITQKNSLSQ